MFVRTISTFIWISLSEKFCNKEIFKNLIINQRRKFYKVFNPALMVAEHHIKRFWLLPKFNLKNFDQYLEASQNPDGNSVSYSRIVKCPSNTGYWKQSTFSLQKLCHIFLKIMYKILIIQKYNHDHIFIFIIIIENYIYHLKRDFPINFMIM